MTPVDGETCGGVGIIKKLEITQQIGDVCRRGGAFKTVNKNTFKPVNQQHNLKLH